MKEYHPPTTVTAKKNTRESFKNKKKIQEKVVVQLLS